MDSSPPRWSLNRTALDLSLKRVFVRTSSSSTNLSMKLSYVLCCDSIPQEYGYPQGTSPDMLDQYVFTPAVSTDANFLVCFFWFGLDVLVEPSQWLGHSSHQPGRQAEHHSSEEWNLRRCHWESFCYFEFSSILWIHSVHWLGLCGKQCDWWQHQDQ